MAREACGQSVVFLLPGLAGALQFDIKTAGENPRPITRRSLSLVFVVPDQKLADFAVKGRRKGDESGTVSREPRLVETWPSCRLTLAIGARQKLT